MAAVVVLRLFVEVTTLPQPL